MVDIVVKMYLINGYVCICLVFLTLYSIGLLNFLSDFEEDKCEMTYMFEYPQFVKISNKMDKYFPKYGLYAYSEGWFTSKVRNMNFNGIPVLFIPGNGGSYKQVRSLSSVALRKALNSRSPYSFDYFTIDLNNELSGLYGPLLYDQLEYVNSSLNRILELYRNENNKPNSIVVIGHSMGGVIANKLISETKAGLISILITLAAPLKRAPIILDYHTDRFYKNLQNTGNNSTLVVSLSGGYSDFLVPSYLSTTNGSNSLYAVTTNIPRSWSESNHVQIVWCKQTVLAISRALFDSIDMKTKQVSKNFTYLNNVFNHHLVRHNGIKPHKLENYDKQIAINYKGEWIEHLSKQYSVEFLHGSKETHWYMLKLTSLPAHQMLSVLAINVETVDWIFACNANLPKGASKVCTEAIHLTHLSEILPSVKYKRRYLEINMQELKKNYTDLTHVVVRALPTKEPLVFHVDIYNLAERQIEVNLPSWWTFMKKTVILEQTVEKAVHYDLVLKQLTHVLQFYLLFVEPLNCQVENHHASATLMVPWGNQNHHAYFTNIEKKPLNIRLYTSRPSNESTSSATVRLILEPSCTYRISIKPRIFGILGQMARLYTPLLLTYVAGVVLLALKYQLKTFKTGHFPIFFAALKEGVKPYHLVPFVKILGALTFVTKMEVDNLYLTEDGIDFFALPILLLFCSIGISFMLSIIYNISLLTLDSTVNKLSLKLTRIFFSIGWSDYLITSVLEKAPFIAAGVLILTSFSTCGGVSLCLGGVFYFLKLTHISQDYIEKIVWFTIKKFGKMCKNFVKRKSQKSDVIEHVTDLNTSDSNNDETLTNKSTDKATKDQNKQDLMETDTDKLREDSPKKIETEVLKGENEISGDESNKESEVIEENIDDVLEESKGIDVYKEKPEPEVNEIGSTEKSDTSQKVPQENDELTTTCNSIFFHSTIFFIWCIITLINLPATLTWAHNFKFTKSLSPDDSFVPGFVLSVCALPLWQFDLPRLNKKWSTHLEIFINIIAVLCVTYATVSVYKLNYLLTLVIVVITLHQLFAPENATECDEQGGETETKSKYDGVKLKLN